MGCRCYICGSKKLLVIRNKIRHSIHRKVLKCYHCELVFLEPKKETPEKFYNKDYRKLYTPVLNKACSSEDIFNIYLPYQNERIDRFKRLFNKGSRVLEIGCSTGHFLYALKKHVKECVGIEINVENADFARKKCKVKIFSYPIEKTGIPKEYFDVIFLFETLEHINDPISLLKTVYNYLKPDGYICIQVPNIKDALLSVYKLKSYEDFYYRRPHIFYFSPKTLSILADISGYAGSIIFSQEYNLINHLHWAITENPMPSVANGSGKPILIKSDGVNKRIKNKLNNWFMRVDQEYKKILCKFEIAQSVIFIGQKKHKGK